MLRRPPTFPLFSLPGLPRHWLGAASLVLLLPAAGPPTAFSGAAGSAPAPAPSPAAAPPQASPYSLTPERRALLNTIRFAEGTWRDGHRDGYRVLYGGGRFQSLARHPEITVRRGYTSAAAGAYQFLPSTWHQTARQLRLKDFSPSSQDQAALHLVQQRHALKRFDREGLSREVLARLAPEWASLPGHDGASAYGQPVKSAEELQQFYSRDLARQRQAPAGATSRSEAPA